MEKNSSIGSLVSGDLIIIFDGENESSNLAIQLAELGLVVTVVRQWSQMQIDYVRSTGSYSAYVEREPLNRASALIYLTPPALSRGHFDPGDEGYVRTERERVLVALLLTCGIPLVNLGWVNRYAWHLRSPEHQVNILAALGWSTPDVTWSYDGLDGKVSKYLSVEVDKLAYLTVNRHTWFLTQISDAQMHVLPPDEALIKLTSAQLKRWDLDWVSIPLVESKGQVYAMGMSASIPRGMSASHALTLLKSSLFA